MTITTHEHAQKDLDLIFQRAMEKGHFGVALRAKELMIKMAGSHETPKKITDMDDDEITYLIAYLESQNA